MTEETKIVFSIEFTLIFKNPKIEKFAKNRKLNL